MPSLQYGTEVRLRIMISIFWLSLSVALFTYEWFKRSLRTLAIAIAVTLTAIFATLGATLSQAIWFCTLGTTLNLFLLEMGFLLGFAKDRQDETRIQDEPEHKPVTVKVIRWNRDDTAIVSYNGREIPAEKESPFIRESNLVDIVEKDGQWLIVKAL